MLAVDHISNQTNEVNQSLRPIWFRRYVTRAIQKGPYTEWKLLVMDNFLRVNIWKGFRSSLGKYSRMSEEETRIIWARQILSNVILTRGRSVLDLRRLSLAPLPMRIYRYLKIYIRESKSQFLGTFLTIMLSFRAGLSATSVVILSIRLQG